MNTVACPHCLCVVPLVLVNNGTCPNCGHDVRGNEPVPPPPPMATPPPIQPISVGIPRRVARHSTAKPDDELTTWITVFLLFVIVGSCGGLFLWSDSRPQAPPKPETREQQLGKHFSPWDGSHRGVTAAIKESMNDPNSYEHVSTFYWDKGDTLIIKTVFRGKNGFGGVVKSTAEAEVDLVGNVLSINFVPQ